MPLKRIKAKVEFRMQYPSMASLADLAPTMPVGADLLSVQLIQAFRAL